MTLDDMLAAQAGAQQDAAPQTLDALLAAKANGGSGGAPTKASAPQVPASMMDRLFYGMADPFHGGAQLLTHMLPDSVVSAGNKLNNWLADKTGLVAPIPDGGVDQMVKDREAAYAPPQGVDWARMAGNVLSPANLAAGSAASSVPMTLAQRMVAGGGLGALASAMTPVTSDNFAATKAAQIGVGAVGGAAVPAAMAGISRVISPAASLNPNVDMLEKAGVQPTIGQTLGGVANSIEEKASSIPILGDAIAMARRRAVNQFNNAAINRVGEPIGVQIKGVGQDAVAAAHEAASNAYDAAKAAMGHFQLDPQATSELANLDAMTASLPSKEQGAYNAVRSYLTNALSPNGSLTAEAFKRFDSKVGADAARFSGSPDAYQQWTGDALNELQRIVTDAGKRANPAAAQAFDAADTAWANLVRVERAAVAAKNNGGVFTPAQLNQAVSASDRSVRKTAVAQGSSLMQDLSNAGQQVLGNKVPNSGTAERLMLGIGGLGSGYVNPAIPVGLVGGALAYTPPMQSLLRAAVTARPALAQPAASLLNRASPMLAPAGGLLSLDVLEQ